MAVNSLCCLTSAEIKKDYSEDKPPTPPKGYKMVESRGTKYGYMYFKYVLDIEPEKKKVKKKYNRYELIFEVSLPKLVNV